MDITFWGVRGSVAVSGPDFVRTGGNTTCVEVQHAGHRLILDGGTGLRALGASLGFQPVEATLLFTHLHWDHIQGVPFFGPAFHPGSNLTLAGVARDAGTLREALDLQMKPPQFPIGLGALCGARQFVDVDPRGPFEIGPFTVTPLEQDHPDGVVAYAIDADGKRFVFATDVEVRGRLDDRMLALAEGCDLLVHDAQYTEAEYHGHAGPPRVGWGHSTWNEAVAVAKDAGVKRLGLFHHDPTRTDDQVAVFEAQAQAIHAPTFAAREGLRVAL